MNAIETSGLLLKESQKRRSYRKFLPEKVDPEVIRNCIKTAVTAPNGANKQPWHFCVVMSDEMRELVRKGSEEAEYEFYTNRISDEWKKDLEKLTLDSFSKPFLTEAPCLIVIFQEYYKVNEDGSKDTNYYVPESVGIATGLLINALRNAGLDTLTYTPAPMAFLNKLFQRPSGEKAEMVLVVGKGDPSYELPELTHKDYTEIADEYL